MAEYTNPCDLCKNRDDCIDDCVLDVYSSKYYCSQYDCFVNYEGTCTLGLYENCGAWEVDYAEE